MQQKFPAAHKLTFIEKRPASSYVECPSFEPGQVSEIVSQQESTGISLVLLNILNSPRELPVALIDAHDSFDPASYGNASCAKLLWLRCQKTAHAIQCADLLLRDGNLPLVLLDLHLACDRELRQVPLATWQRFKNEARSSGTTFVALTPRQIVPTPHKRFSTDSSFSLENLELKRPRPRFIVSDGKIENQPTSYHLRSSTAS